MCIPRAHMVAPSLSKVWNLWAYSACFEILRHVDTCWLHQSDQETYQWTGYYYPMCHNQWSMQRPNSVYHFQLKVKIKLPHLGMGLPVCHSNTMALFTGWWWKLVRNLVTALATLPGWLGCQFRRDESVNLSIHYTFVVILVAGKWKEAQCNLS